MNTAPDFIYDPEDWDATHCWVDRVCLIEDRFDPAGTVKRFRTLVHGPDKFAARIPVAWDDDGDVEDDEWEWFDSEDEAKAAIAKAKAP